MKRTIVAIITLLFLVLAMPAKAAELSFEDKSTYNNFIVSLVEPNGVEHLLSKSGDGFALNLDDYSEGESLKLAILFFVPNEAGSESFEVRHATKMQVNLEISLTKSLLENDTNVPVYYFDSIGRRGFDQIDPVSQTVTDRLFEQYFKAALMAEHYYLRMGTYDSPEYRRAFKLWRDASYTLATRKLDWWEMAKDIADTARTAFPRSSTIRQSTELYYKEARR